MTETEQRIDVLDHGYVILQDKMGSDLTPVNAARVSFNKKRTELSDRDKGLIRFLADENHSSPFRHAILQFECYAPLMVARQHWKYRVGSAFEEPDMDYMDGWNESSRRYITEEPTFYIPKVWRGAPANLKQGSGDAIDSSFAVEYTEKLKNYVQDGAELYEYAVKDGFAPEQARIFLPAYGMYVRYYWTVSLAGLIHFLNQRLADDAQEEISLYAGAFQQLTQPHFPETFDAFGLGLS
jgi:thymidylate synthase (FAD)